MAVLAKGREWAGANFVPLVLLPLAAGLVWVGIWRVWLPPSGGGGAIARAVTTVDSNRPTRPTRKVTTVVHTTHSAAPSRRSEALALALVFLGAGAAVIAVFHNRIGSLELTRTGIKIDLTPAEQSGAAALVGRLAGCGASPKAYARGLDRYLHAIAARRPSLKGAERSLGADEAAALADRIADEIV